MNALLTAAVGAPAVPNIAGMDQDLQDLFEDAENQLPFTDVVANGASPRAAEASINLNPPPPYELEYNPGWPDQEYLISSLLHELLHVSVDRNYDRGGLGGGPGLDFKNMNFPAGLAGAAIGAEMNAQDAVLRQNLNDAVTVTTNDATLGGGMQAHILNRLNNYALAQPGVHYDTVLADIMAYMELNGVTAGTAYDFIRRLVRESTDRRLNRPWWGVRRVRRVNRNAGKYAFWAW
jgi:hypothetical protein